MYLVRNKASTDANILTTTRNVRTYNNSEKSVEGKIPLTCGSGTTVCTSVPIICIEEIFGGHYYRCSWPIRPKINHFYYIYQVYIFFPFYTYAHVLSSAFFSLSLSPSSLHPDSSMYHGRPYISIILCTTPATNR